MSALGPDESTIRATWRWLAHGAHGVSEVRVIRPAGGIIGIVLMLVAGLSLQRAMGRAALDAQADSSLQHSVLVESIAGAETLKASRAEGQMLGRWRRYAAMSAATQEKLRRVTSVAVNLASICQQAISVGLVVGGFYLFQKGDISMGAIIAIVMLAGRSMSPIGQFAFLLTRAKTSMTTLDSLQRMMEATDERQVASADAEVTHAQPADQRVLHGARERDAPGLVVVHAAAAVGERVHPVRQRVVVDRDQHLGVGPLGQIDAGPEVERNVGGAGEQHPGAVGFQQRLERLRDRAELLQVCFRLPEEPRNLCRTVLQQPEEPVQDVD